MTRIAENDLARSMLTGLFRNQEQINKASNEISSGIKVSNPGDSDQSGAISLLQQMLGRIDGYGNRITSLTSELTFQDDAISQANDLLIRAKEIATAAGNETNGVSGRAQMAEEVFQLRDHLVQIANAQFQGRFIFGGTADNDPPYDLGTYTTPATGKASQRWAFDAATGRGDTRTVKIADSFTITTNTPANQLFNNAVQGLELLGRALAGYQSSDPPIAGDGAAYAATTAGFAQQTSDIQAAIRRMDLARESDLLPQRTDLGGRLERLQTAQALNDLNKNSAKEALSKLQDADLTEAATELTQAQTALQASLQVTLKILSQNILDYI